MNRMHLMMQEGIHIDKILEEREKGIITWILL